MCLFIQNLEIHKINKLTVALKLNLNCILYVYIDSYISITYKQSFNLEASEAEADKICFIRCILSPHLCLLILLCLEFASLYKQF